jgi:guanylate kinase
MSLVAGNIFLVSAPSGAGKSSLVNALLTKDPSIRLSVSCTTRAPRPGEVDGKDYRFLTVEAFQQLEQAGQFIEWATVHDNFYGTPRDWIDQLTSQGKDVLLEIDWQGARQVKKLFPNTIGIFILPPSIQALEERLQLRGQDSQAVIAKRILAANEEIEHAQEYEYVIINQDFSVALRELELIIHAARLRYNSQSIRHATFFSSFGLKKLANS